PSILLHPHPLGEWRRGAQRTDIDPVRHRSIRDTDTLRDLGKGHPGGSESEHLLSALPCERPARVPSVRASCHLNLHSVSWYRGVQATYGLTTWCRDVRCAGVLWRERPSVLSRSRRHRREGCSRTLLDRTVVRCLRDRGCIPQGCRPRVTPPP